MRHLLLTTIATVLVVGCKSASSQRSAEIKPGKPVAEAKPAKAKEDSELLDAAKNGNIEVVKQRLAAGADVESRCTSCGGTALSHAAGGGHMEVAGLLIAAGANVNAKDDVGFTPLDKAEVYAGLQPWHATFDKLITDFIRKHGGKSGEWFKAGESIQIAAKVGHIEAVKQHLAAGVDVNAKGSSDAFGFGAMMMPVGGERTPLSWAAFGGHKDVVELLIAAGADLNASGFWEKTPLHGAVEEGHREVVNLLLANGANLNERDREGKTPLDKAIAVGSASLYLKDPPNVKAAKVEIAKILRKHGGKTGTEVSIHVAAQKGAKEDVKHHLDSGVNVNAKDEIGGALHYAAWFGGNTETVVLLIAAGADVNAKNIEGITPLDFAEKVEDWQSPETKAAKKEIADLLRKHGAKTGEELKAERK